MTSLTGCLVNAAEGTASCRPNGGQTRRRRFAADSCPGLTDASSCCPSRHVHRSDAFWDEEEGELMKMIQPEMRNVRNRKKALNDGYAPDVAHAQCAPPLIQISQFVIFFVQQKRQNKTERERERENGG